MLMIFTRKKKQMTSWPFFSFLKSSEFGNNKAHDTFSPDAKITLKGLPFYSSVRTRCSPPNLSHQNVCGSKETYMHVPGNDCKKKKASQ